MECGAVFLIILSTAVRWARSPRRRGVGPMKSASCCMLLLALSLTAQTASEDSAVSKLHSTLLPLAKLPKIPEGNDFIGVPLQKELRQFNRISQQVVEDMMSL